MNHRIRALRPDVAPRQWYSIKNAAKSSDGPATVYLFDEIDSWFGVSAEDFARELDDIDAGEILVKINSPGGNVFDALAIMNALVDHPAQITTSVEGLAASAASFIAMAGDTIVMRPGAEMMIHNAWGVVIGGAADMRDMADQLDRTSANLAQIYADRAGGDIADWQKAMAAETWYSADEAVEAGLADRVEKPGKGADDTGAKARHDLSIFNYAGRQHAPAPRPIRSPSARVRAEVTPGKEGTMPTLIEGLRERLGLSDDADEASVLEAVTTQLDSAGAATGEPGPADAPPEPTLAQMASAAKGLGLRLIATEQYDQLAAQAAQGAQAFARQQTDRRENTLNEAIRTGRIAKAQREHFAKLHTADPEGTETLLASLAPGLAVPLDEIGHAGEPDIDRVEAEAAGVFARVTGTQWKA